MKVAILSPRTSDVGNLPTVVDNYPVKEVEDITKQPIKNIPTKPNWCVWIIDAEPETIKAIDKDDRYDVISGDNKTPTTTIYRKKRAKRLKMGIPKGVLDMAMGTREKRKPYKDTETAIKLWCQGLPRENT